MADAADDATPITSLPLEWLPWHDGARTRLETALAGGRLPHGLLLHGPDGVGKEHFAAVLAAGRSAPVAARASRPAAPARNAR